MTSPSIHPFASLSVAARAMLAQDMASALRYMHEQASAQYAYICRDLKPDNIGFTADGELKIFGESRP